MKNQDKTLVSSSSFYCQNVCGDENFSIDEWNKAYHEVKDKSQEIQRMVLDGPGQCEKQCFECIALVGNRRLKTQEIMQGFILKNGEKTTPGIEKIVAESVHAGKSVDTRYF